jgi:transcriptional activator of comK gene
VEGRSFVMAQSNQFKAILLTAGTLSMIIIFLLAFQVHTTLNQRTSNLNTNDPLSVGILTSDSIYDQSWGSLAYEGHLRIIEQFPVQVDMMSEVDTETKMRDVTLQMISDGVRLMIGHGREFAPVFTQLAPQHPDVHFVTINGMAQHSNQSSFTSHPESYGYFAGMLAALMTKTNKIAIIDSYSSNAEGLAGFKLALEEYNPEATFYLRSVGSRDDEVKAAKLADELIELGVDVIFPQGNAFNRAVIYKAEKANIQVIGYITDQAYMAEQSVLTSVLIDLSEAYVLIIGQYFSSEGIPSGNIILDFKDGVYDLAPFGQMVPEKVRKRVITQLEKYNQGKFQVDFNKS